MCGRFAVQTPPDRLAELFDADVDPAVVEEWSPSWNVAKTDPVLAITAGDDGQRTLGAYRWGLVPWFAGDPAKARLQ